MTLKDGFAFQFGKFSVIGLSNSVVDLGVLNLLMLATGIKAGLIYSLFKAISFIFGMLNSFIWNKLWTFNAEGAFSHFFLVSMIGLVINVLIASIIVNGMGLPQTAFWANFGALISFFFTAIWNFLGYKYLVFKK